MIEALAPELQARAIHVAAEHAAPTGADRRYIASVWDVLQETGSTALDLPAFKALLLTLQRAGAVRLTRLDLVGAGERELVERSETRRPGYGGHVTEYHLLALG